MSAEAESVSKNIRLGLHQLLNSDPTELAQTPQIDNGYTVSCLDREQGIQWVIKERLPFFLKSDLYFEYRLVRLLVQWKPKLCVQRRAISSAQTGLSSNRTKCSDSFMRSSSCCELEYPCTLSSLPPESSPNITEPFANSSEVSYVKETTKSSTLQIEFLAAKVVKQVLNAAVRVMGGHNQANTSHCFSGSGAQTNDGPCVDCSLGCKVHQNSPARDEELLKRDESSNKTRTWEMRSEGTQWKNGLEISCNDNCSHSDRVNLDVFKEILRGTPGEGLLNLWMDIERMNATESRERRNRCLALMRSRYVLSSSQTCLNVELLSRLGLSTSSCWTQEKLQSVQPQITHSLLFYWAPRFWTSHRPHEDDFLNVWTDRCVSSTSTIQPQLLQNYTVPPLCSKSYLSSSPSVTELCPSRGPLLCSGQMERMIQALCVDSWAGLYFTHFCEQSGNQLWENAIYFWRDLQHYHELFYQDGLDPYRVQREAQVQMQEEIRRVDSQEYRELQSLYEESKIRLKQEQCESVLSPPVPSSALFSCSRVSESWSKVSSEYKGYRLGSLLRHRYEIGHFMTFLQKQDASVHLSCWLDLEQYRRTPQTDTAVRLEKSSYITTKYLNRKYFFGPDSPASIDQQHKILRLTGGLERLKLDCLSNVVVMEIQDIVRSHIETKWLPEFLSTAEFTERQKDKPKLHAAGTLSQHRTGRHRRKTRKEAWKAEGLWMSSSKEILLFRRVLLDPVACLQFQHFVSLKGDFLENDVLFWLEVQRYKDLCHSHSDEATIQKKISTIISVFITSSLPPPLQIDIPPAQAQHILENRHKLGPYVFREAQMSVFSELLRFWPEFQELRSSVREEQLLPLLEQKRLKHRARVRRQRRKEDEEEEEERRVQEELQKQESSFRDEDETDVEEDNSDEERSERRASKTQSRLQFTPTQALSWSYSKYMAALKKEEVLLRRQSQLEAPYSTASESSPCSVKSAGSVPSPRQPSLCSRTSSQQRQRYSKGVKAFNMK